MWTAILLLSTGFLVYVLAGYPLLLGWMAGRKRRPVVKDASYQPTVTVLLPVRNGERWIEGKLRTLAEQDYPLHLIDILVISDGSTDTTEALVEAWAGRGEAPRLRLLRQAPAGKAAALNLGLREATGELLFMTDVRQDLSANALSSLAACLGDPSVGAASGELIILDGVTREEASIGLYWRYEKWMRERLSAIDSVMGATGAIYMIRRALTAPLPDGTLVDDMYLPLKAFFAGKRVILDREARAYDLPTALDTEFRRKVRTQAGVYQLMGLMPELLTWRNRMWIHFLSQKVGRLMMPLGMLGVLAGSLGAGGVAGCGVFVGAGGVLWRGDARCVAAQGEPAQAADRAGAVLCSDAGGGSLRDGDLCAAGHQPVAAHEQNGKNRAGKGRGWERVLG